MADLDEISGVQGLLLPTRQACTPKCPGVHTEAQATAQGVQAGSGAGRLTKAKHGVST